MLTSEILYSYIIQVLSLYHFRCNLINKLIKYWWRRIHKRIKVLFYFFETLRRFDLIKINDNIIFQIDVPFLKFFFLLLYDEVLVFYIIIYIILPPLPTQISSTNVQILQVIHLLEIWQNKRYILLHGANREIMIALMNEYNKNCIHYSNSDIFDYIILL